MKKNLLNRYVVTREEKIERLRNLGIAVGDNIHEGTLDNLYRDFIILQRKY